ncbi:acetyltransferase [Cronobacter universalis]|uniref:acetyltransferase n=1 Tax=Cronobacter universalis TaxID=535744 RepID=UPI0024AF669D|nr:acetyltransferase [Cronobacter universalis]MDI7659363.1 acetyltransferase [Cronobacter universalis]
MSESSTNKPIVLIGGGGHASVVADILKQQGRDIIAIISPNVFSKCSIFNNIDIFEKDEEILRFNPAQVVLVNAIGVLPGKHIRKKINEYYLEKGYHFESVVSDGAYISPYAKLKPGVQIFTGAIIQAGVIIEDHTIINSGAVIEHDCYIGKYNFVAPRAVICGQCKTEEDVFIGANATVVQSIHLNQGVIIGANALVTKDIFSGQRVYAQRSVIR